ncbi:MULTISPECIES: NADPH-dependent FMN reductase [unclassified Sphingopyxis]|jgi:NAD(P)H-dependent FMN reductase|uniref:NADPH-dependent FMN reductase n=1 Tax=unclassified Sphingopyxis TaxID=2614943 RepID=UPI0006C1D5D7|nr:MULTISPECIES: NADPH-dependent FMN reductase [unclassified Sphingopyxis]USI77927.1 NAD(P)H-dependent oxidoreductase [Sphingopyxis sp. USTB-05]GAO79707.1 NADPH-dependent FMN reductase [Sphingopyxis sp. C-1]
MSRHILVFYGSYRRDRQGLKLVNWLVDAINTRGDRAELIDAKAVDLPMLDRMYKEYPKGEAPAAMEELAGKIRAADGFLFVTGEYNWGPQPGLKNLTDHYLEEWFWRPAAIACYSAGSFSGVRAMMGWRDILGEMGMAVISSILPVARIGKLFDADGQPTGDDAKQLERLFPRFADDLNWWIDAAKVQRAKVDPPY